MIPKKILFCTDFSDNSGPALQEALNYAETFGAELWLLHVINSSQVGYPSMEGDMPPDIRSTLEAIQASVSRTLELLAEQCRRRLPAVSTHTIIGVPSYEIVRYAQEHGMALIIMGTHGWTGFKHLILGSTAENVVRTAICPVLTVRSVLGEQSPTS
jgi:nucleotide-binding universal stress UspA family protein